MMKQLKFILTIFFGFSVLLASSQENENYIKTYTARESGLTDLISENSASKVSRVSQYFDGLGRPIQQVIRKGSPTQKDVIMVTGYDDYGRAYRQYLPYTISRTADEEGNYDAASETNASAFYTDPYHFTSSVYELSALGRTKKVFGPGSNWRFQEGGNTLDRPVSYTYKTNTSQDVIPYFDVSNDQDQVITFNGNYHAGTLWVTGTKDEDGHESLEFTDKFGRTVARRVDPSGINACTYYIYDDYGNLTFVIPPQAVSNAISNWESNLNNATFRKNWLFRYRYDLRGRMIEKQVPGASPVYLVYDERDRLVLTQDGNLRLGATEYVASGTTKVVNSYDGKSYVREPGARIVLKKPNFTASKNDGFSVLQTTSQIMEHQRWLYTKYDELNRPVMTGFVTINNRSHDQLQEQVQVNQFALNYNHTLAGNNYGYHANGTIPGKVSEEVLTVTFYDDYTFKNHLGWGSIYDTGTGISPKNEVNGRVTGGLTKVLGESTFLKNIVYYDARNRPLVNINENHLGGTDRVQTDYFDLVSPNVSQITRNHSTVSGSTEIIETFTYDHMDRLLKHVTTIDGTHTSTIRHTYNEIGELVEKDMNGVQSVDYDYNIRGWLSKINGGITFDDATDKFGMELKYENAASGYENYNGNIGQMVWKSSSTTDPEQTYSYTYDDLNRLKKAQYTGGAGANKYNVTGDDAGKIRYDLNGNIKRLIRSYDGNVMDDLSYIYENGNQLSAVGDGSAFGGRGFLETHSEGAQAGEYTYDLNGNMISDANKNITKIEYNHLNLPKQVTFGNGNYVNYTYDAYGTKLAKATNIGADIDYIAGIHYRNGALDFVQHSEGRFTYSNSTYAYNLTDHLGNVRVTVNEFGNVVQRDGYYPFGMAFNHSAVSPENHYKYNGKEEQKETGWLDYGFRFYDPELGRFFGVDPIAEQFVHVSPYNYAENEPVGSIDLWGLQRWKVNGRDMASAPSRTRTKLSLAGSTTASERKVIGTPGFGKKNVTQNSSRVAIHMAEDGNMSTGLGTERNAVRHALWSAGISSALGGEAAQRITNAKEGVSSDATSELDMSQSFEGDINLADNIVDLLNNEIGIAIGEENEGASITTLAGAVLAEFKVEGLWTATENEDGSISIQRTKISNEQYQNAIKTLHTLDQNGMNQEDRDKVENANN